VSASWARRAGRALRRLGELTRPVPRELEEALARRWAELPEGVRTPAQTLGRRSAGCEGTHGIVPRCDLACTPCYHGREANLVRVDGPHALAAVDDQMAYLRRRRGPGQNAQLIGGEVSLLEPEDHAAALIAMHRHGRKPMSMTHGDFDEEYLRRLALGPDGRPRLARLWFAAHFDSLMLGRRGIPRPACEADLHPFRARFCEMFRRLREETGVRSYLAHNMTVTPANVDQVPGVIDACRDMGFSMFSFQPAAFIGNPARWREPYRELSADEVWAAVEAGAGARLPYRVIQHGDERCNRAAYGALVGRRWVPFLDDRNARDMRVRDALFATVGAMDLHAPRALLLARAIRALARRPSALPLGVGWAVRFARRAGPGALARHGARPLTFVMHRFMDAADVRLAWELMGRGETSADPRIRETQERLRACSYHMAHPELDLLVPACVQHGVLDPEANRRLARLLPLEG
jgi:hypothetical protein